MILKKGGGKREKSSRGRLIFVILFLTISLSLVYAEEFGYNNPSLPQLTSELFDGFNSTFFMPNNKSVFGNFSFNGGFLNGGCTIRDGAILCQEGFFVNISSLNVTQQNLTILTDLTVDGNVTADNFIGNSSIWSRAGTNTFLTNLGDNVGIGETNPLVPLHITKSNLGKYVAIAVENSRTAVADDVSIDFRPANFGAGAEIQGIAPGSSDVDLAFTTVNAGSASELMRLTGNGNVGIGTDAPTALLNVNGEIKTGNNAGNTNGQITWESANGNQVIAQITNSDNLAFAGATGDYTFSDGNVGIGTTSPTSLLHINETASDEATTPTLSFGDGDTGFYESADDNLQVSISGSKRFLWTSGFFRASGGNAFPQIANEESTSTNPVFMNALNDANSGIGGASGTVALITNSLTRLHVANDGNIGIGTTTPVSPLEIQSLSASIRQTRYSDTASQAAGLTVQRSRGTTVGTDVIVQDGDRIANFNLRGYDGVSYRSAASIEALIDGTPGGGDMPGRLVFSTTSDGASSVTERMRITSQGFVGIGITSPLNVLDVVGNGSFSNNLNVDLNLTVDTSTFFVDSNNNRVGIGTTTPLAKLEINAGTNDIFIGEEVCNTGFTGIQIGNSLNDCTNYTLLGDGTNTFINRPTGGSIFFRENNSNQMILDATGKVGIGTTSPQQELNVIGDGNFTGELFVGGNFTTSTGGIIGGNATCVFIFSPAGTSRLEICD